jgi:DNA-binding Lrp family transcriptional regulator
MDPLLQTLQENALVSRADLALQLGVTEEEVGRRIREYEEAGVILGYEAVLDDEKLEGDSVTAMIEIRVTPERGGGFDRLASRIARFEQVQSCYLMSGAYDLLVIIRGHTLREVSSFVTQKLSTLEGVVSTATHFQLKAYKQNGFLSEAPIATRRLAVAP